MKSDILSEYPIHDTFAKFAKKSGATTTHAIHLIPKFLEIPRGPPVSPETFFKIFFYKLPKLEKSQCQFKYMFLVEKQLGGSEIAF